MADGDRWTSKWRPSGASSEQPNSQGRSEREGFGTSNTAWQRWRVNQRGDGGTGSDRPSAPQQHRDHEPQPQRQQQQQQQRADGWGRGDQRHDSGGGRQGAQDQRQRQPQQHGGGQGRSREETAPLDAGTEAADDEAAVDLLQQEFGQMGLGDGFGFVGGRAGASGPVDGRRRQEAGALEVTEAGGAGWRGEAALVVPVPDGDMGLPALEAAVASGSVAGWSLEQLGRAAASLVDAWEVRAKPSPTHAASGTTGGWHHYPFQVCYTPREAAVVKAIAAAATCAAAALQQRLQRTTPQHAQAVARLLRMCARANYWSGPGEAAVRKALQQRSSAAGDGPGAAAGLADDWAWPGLSPTVPAAAREVPAAASAPASAPGATNREASDGAGGAPLGSPTCPGQLSSQPQPQHSQPSLPYTTVGQALVAALAANDCALLAQLDVKGAANVAWSLSRAGVLASLAHFDTAAHPGNYVVKLLKSLDEGSGCGRGEAKAAAALLAEAPAALTQALRARCQALMTEATVAELCGMSFASGDAATLQAASAPAAGSGGDGSSSCRNSRLLADLAADALQEVASRLEAAVFLGLEVAGSGGSKVAWGSEPRMRTFLPRELACVAFSAGKLGLGANPLARLLTALSEYLICTRGRLPWNASTLGIFVCGASKLVVAAARSSTATTTTSSGSSQELRRCCSQLLETVEECVLELPPSKLDPRSVSFLLSYLGRMGAGRVSRHVESHLTGALMLHSPASLEPRNACHLLFGLCANGPAAAASRRGGGGGGEDGGAGGRSRYMAFEGGVARQDPMLAHLCAALAAAAARRLSPADVCMAVTSLSRLHGGKVLASQVPEVVAALENLAAHVARRGFGAGADDDAAAVPFTCREVSNFIVALAQLKFYSPGVMAALRDHAAAGGLQHASSWDTSALLYGLAWLNYDWRDGLVLAREGGGGGGGGNAGGGAAAMPPPPRSPALAVDLVGLLADVVVRKGRGASSQDLTNALWGLTIMEGALDRYRDAVKALVAEANARGAHSFHPRDLKQVWPVERELRALPAPYTRLSDDLVRAGRLNSSECDHTFSRVQGDLNRTLSAMHRSGRWPGLRDLQYEQELVPGGDMLMKIDVQVTVERRGGELAHVAVEFDGPFHFMVNEPYCWRRVDGRTALRDRVLERHLGRENVAVVNMEEWVEASDDTHGMPGRWRLLAEKIGLGEPAF